MRKTEKNDLKKLLTKGYVVIKNATSIKECNKIKKLYFNIFKKYKKKFVK